MKNKIKNLPYARILIPDQKSGRYSAEILEFHGCFSEGATPEEAYNNLDKAGANWIDSAQKQGMDIPAPLVLQSNKAKCPCCNGSGFVEKEGSIVDEIRALEWMDYGGTEDMCPVCCKLKSEGHATGCEFAAILRRLK